MSEQVSSPKEVASIEDSRRIAKEIYDLYKDKLEGYAPEEVDGIKTKFGQYPNLVEEYLRDMPDEVQSHFWAHGITRGDKLDQLTSVISVLSNSAIRGDTAKLRGSGFIDAWTQGGFVILSKKDQFLMPRNPTLIKLGDHTYTGEPIKAARVDVGATVVNDEFIWIVEELRKRFPNMRILKPSELPAYLSQ